MTAVVERPGALSGELAATLETVGRELDRAHVPGLELAVVRDGEVLFAGGFGVRGVEDPAPASATTLFHHGSCGKAYTGLLAAVLAEAGVVDLDEPVRRYVPELRLPDPVVADRVTIRDLLSHRSGLHRHDLVWILNPSLPREDLVRRLAHLPLAGDLRNQWVYSNFGFTLAGLALGRAGGTGYEDELRTRVLAPLGMSRTLTSVTQAQSDPDCARPHLLRGDRAVATPFRRLDGVAPAGQLLSCAEDSVRWLRAHLGADDAVAATAVQSTHAIAMPVPAGASPFPELDFVGYGMGWLAGAYRDRRLVWHNGGVDGFSTQTLLLPRDGIGIVASANLHATNFPFAVVLAVADALLGVAAGESWFDRMRGTDPDPAAETPVVPPQPAAPPPAGPSHPLAAYAGVYADPGYGDLTVCARDDGLQVRIGETDVTARHRHYDTWDLHYAPLDQDLTVTFGLDADGVVAEAVIPLDPASPPARFHRGAEEQTT